MLWKIMCLTLFYMGWIISFECTHTQSGFVHIHKEQNIKIILQLSSQCDSVKTLQLRMIRWGIYNWAIWIAAYLINLPEMERKLDLLQLHISQSSRQVWSPLMLWQRLIKFGLQMPSLLPGAFDYFWVSVITQTYLQGNSPQILIFFPHD